MITKEKFGLLADWLSYAAPKIQTEGLSRLSCAVLGLLLAELPDNHAVFNAPLPIRMDRLAKSIDDYSKAMGEEDYDEQT